MHTVWPKIDPTSENHIQPQSYLCFLSTSGDVFTGLSACNVIEVVIFLISYSSEPPISKYLIFFQVCAFVGIIKGFEHKNLF